MKKLLKIFTILFIFMVFAGIKVEAYTTTSEVNSAIERISTKEYDLLHTLNTYVDTYKDDLKDVFTYDNAVNTNDYSFNALIDRVITLLNSKNHTEAASELTALKPTLIQNYNDISSEYVGVKEFLEINKNNTILSLQEVLINAKKKSATARSEFKTFYNKYFDLYFDGIKTKISSTNDIKDFEVLIDKVYDTFIGNTKLLNEVSLLQDYYEVYELDQYELIIKDFLMDEYNTIYNKYTEVYTYAKNTFKTKVDNKIAEYKTSLDVNSIESATEFNNKIYEMLDKVDFYQEYFNNKKTSIYNLIKIKSLKDKLTKEEAKINEGIEQTREYIRKNLIEVKYIELADPNDSSYITIDHENKLIIYSGTNLDINYFISKFNTAGGYTLSYEKDYHELVGTKTELVVVINATLHVHYTVVVKGDVNPDGKISSVDYVTIKNHIMGDQTITDDLLKIAANLNNDEKISTVDYILVKNIIMDGEN